MLEAIRSFFARASGNAEVDAVAGWARRQGHQWKREKDGAGFAIEGRMANTPWRLEWGPSQRPYIADRELRIRMVLGLPADLQLLLMTQPLKEMLEKEAFELGTQGNQTLVGNSASEEMRWLVMFPKIAFGGSKVLRSHFAGVASLRHEGAAWLDGELSHSLERSVGTWLSASPPFLLMTLRGRIYLRVQLASADETDVAAAVELFEVAATAASRVASARGDAPVTWKASVSTAWQTLPPDKRE